MYRPLCLCDQIPRFDLPTRIVVVMHWRERHLTTNTAKLATLALPNSEIRLRGGRHPALPAEGLTNAALLYPTEDAVELTETVVSGLPRPLTLIVPDGSWRQARKVAIREPALERVPRYKLPPGPPTQYRLRHSPHLQNLSTFEAIARAIGLLENCSIQSELEALFLKMVERRLWSRGRLLAADCTTGIPIAAFEAAHEAGVRGGKKSRS